MSKLYLQHDYAVTGKDYVETEGGDTPAGSGIFIDTATVIKEFTAVNNTTATYTATEDCAIVYSLTRDTNTSTYVKIDEIKVAEGYDSNGIGAETGLLYVKAGQVVEFKSSYASATDGYTVYGLTN